MKQVGRICCRLKFFATDSYFDEFGWRIWLINFTILAHDGLPNFTIFSHERLMNSIIISQNFFFNSWYLFPPWFTKIYDIVPWLIWIFCDLFSFIPNRNKEQQQLPNWIRAIIKENVIRSCGCTQIKKIVNLKETYSEITNLLMHAIHKN